MDADCAPFLRRESIEQSAMAVASATGVREVGPLRERVAAVYRSLHMFPHQSPAATLLVVDAAHAASQGFARQIECFTSDASLALTGDLRGTCDHRQIERTKRCASALAEDLHYEGSLSSLLFVAVCSPLPFFGSHRRALGTIFVGPQETDDEWDIQQLLLHELVHQALFLAELAMGIYADSTLTCRNEVVRKERPYAMTFHAAFVCWTLAERAWRARRIEESAVMLHSLELMLGPLAAQATRGLDPNGQRLMAWLRNRVQNAAWAREVAGSVSRDAADEFARRRPRSYLASRE